MCYWSFFIVGKAWSSSWSLTNWVCKVCVWDLAHYLSGAFYSFFPYSWIVTPSLNICSYSFLQIAAKFANTSLCLHTFKLMTVSVWEYSVSKSKFSIGMWVSCGCADSCTGRGNTKAKCYGLSISNIISSHWKWARDSTATLSHAFCLLW